MTSTVLRQARLTARRHDAQAIRDRVRADIDTRLGQAGAHRTHRQRPFRLRLWLPVSLLWLLFPLVILISPVAWIWRASALRLIIVVAALLAGLPGSLVEVESPDADIHIRLV
jgi:hypothetical protein